MSKIRNSLRRGVKGLVSLLLGAGAFADPTSALPARDPSSIESRVKAVRANAGLHTIVPDQQTGDITARPIAQWGNFGNWNNWGNWANWNNWNNWGNWGNWRNF